MGTELQFCKVGRVLEMEMEGTVVKQYGYMVLNTTDQYTEKWLR